MSGQPPSGGDGRREVAAFFAHPAPAWRRQTPVPWWKSLTQPRWSSGVPQPEHPPVVVAPVPGGATPAAEPAGGTRWEPEAAACVPTPFGAYEPGPYGSWAALADRTSWAGAHRPGEERADKAFRLACAMLAVATVLVGAALIALTRLGG
ncbi:hypothetical protein ACTHAM_001367 [Cellulomonas soli]|uniref:hypothetical protein n=1 Tax=Cellulomonas soli TaxID=931535 RepID=UPI003F827DD6